MVIIMSKSRNKSKFITPACYLRVLVLCCLLHVAIDTMQYWSCHSYWEFGSCKSLLTLSNTEVPPGCEGGTGTWLIPPGIASIPCTGWPKAAIMDEPGQYLGVNKDGVAFARRQARPSCMFSHIHRTCPFLAPALESNGEHWGDMPRCASPTDEPFVTVSGDLTLYRFSKPACSHWPMQFRVH